MLQIGTTKTVDNNQKNQLKCLECTRKDSLGKLALTRPIKGKAVSSLIDQFLQMGEEQKIPKRKRRHDDESNKNKKTGKCEEP